jgi:hypothetical protein
MQIKVRMYRHGLGDCFLLAFPAKDGGTFYMMIDCGVLQHVDGGPERLQMVARDVVTTTEGKLDAFVMTHEHWDHISGFSYRGSSDELAKLEIKKTWFSFLEDPANTDATTLDRYKIAKIAALWNASALLGQVPAATGGTLGAVCQPLQTGIQSLLAFTGPRDLELEKSVAAGPAALATRRRRGAGGAPGGAADGAAGDIIRTLRQTRDFLRGLGAQPPSYLEPGQVVTLPEVDGVRFDVLGPPCDTHSLHSMESKNKDVIYQNPLYERSLTGDFLGAVQTKIGGPVDEQLTGGDADQLQPFAPRYRHPLDDQAMRADDPDYQAFKKLYHPGEPSDDDWRKIDDDWLLQASSLALDLDTFTNNTSLALAIELVQSQKVLLFVGDAQIGNWQSWQGHTWTVQDPGGATRTVQIGDLLRRTVFYKVGHHGSHNATLSSQGLELMVSPDLVAMIPVDEQQASKQGGGWLMPAPLLYSALRDRTRGRIGRDDTGIASEEECEMHNLTPAEYLAFTAAMTPDQSADQLYIDYVVSD